MSSPRRGTAVATIPGMTDLDQRTVRALVRAMPKAELHLHLDGSLRIDTALDIARTRGIDAPTTFAGMRGVLVGPEQATDQAELLEAFDLPIELMQDAEAIERIAAPTLVVTTDEDTVYPPATAEALAKRIPGARVALIAGAGHVSNLERPEAFNATVLGFLREHRERASIPVRNST